MGLIGRVAIIVAMVSAAPAVLAQSLVDVARQEEARRASIRKPSKVFTNATLSPAPDQAAGSTRGQAPAVAAAAPLASGNSTSATAAAPAVKPAAATLDEKQWRSRAALLRAGVAAARRELAALDGASHADPREQAMLETLRKRRQAALAESEEARRRFEIQADAAQVPRAWLQEPSE